MKTKNVSFPHPVLGISDDVKPLLTDGCVELTIRERKSKGFVFSVQIKQENATIENLIKAGRAEYACEVECKETYLRFCKCSNRPTFVIELDRTCICGSVTFSCFITAKQEIKQYTNPGFNEDYKGFSFDLEPGDLLAVFPLISHNVDIRFDKLYAAGTYMQIVEGSKNLEHPWFNLGGPKINIELPPNMYQQYLQFANTSFIDAIHASLVYNGLVYALQEYVNNPDEYEGKLWYDSLEARISGDSNLSHIDMSDLKGIYEVADIILGNPYKRMFDRMQNFQ